MNDRLRIRIPVYGAEGQFKKFFFWTADRETPALTASSKEVFGDKEYCTGWKDKNNRLIWEGDILFNPKTAERGTVFWNEEHEYYCYAKNSNKSLSIPLTDLLFEGWLIMGNIHENPDLLEAQNGDN